MMREMPRSKGDENDEAYDQRQSLRGPSGAMRTQPKSTSK
jgi:hypothetical protein